MLKKIIITMAISTTVIMTGCASKPKAITIGKLNDAPQILIKVRNGAGAPSWSYNESKAFRNVLESAATVTLQKGYKYFAIVKPNEISNIQGAMINSAEELLKRCDPADAAFINIAGAGLHKCGVYNTKATLVIALYNKKPVDFTVYDAQQVIDYLKSKGLYEGQGIETTK
ncbi:hypothetical protein [Hydrogenimonas thermophila]|uniref:Lipoprotein n=1 Tax=Hydrogenimonas thermophila TaxID=223786 RepID=A0A1I5P896_9BACT|nr:hypothetical protein [Hydrogenimonas thermophila]SFP29761.1 hypothetical protein SAMN05216234_1143 [Hydrogenimonas thermophila]